MPIKLAEGSARIGVCICAYVGKQRRGAGNAKALRQESFWGAVTQNGVQRKVGAKS